MPQAVISTGVPGCGHNLGGRLPGRPCLDLVRGAAGVGNTTLDLRFELEGARRGESGPYIAVSEWIALARPPSAQPHARRGS